MNCYPCLVMTNERTPATYRVQVGNTIQHMCDDHATEAGEFVGIGDLPADTTIERI